MRPDDAIARQTLPCAHDEVGMRPAGDAGAVASAARRKSGVRPKTAPAAAAPRRRDRSPSGRPRRGAKH
ncbi:MAG: hypothetical protein MZW92_17790 [Comamonadaceae bacterium]|nr:hypothetical protein [Comamonadaceae bacterium]